jgi:hypothetical protein
MSPPVGVAACEPLRASFALLREDDFALEDFGPARRPNARRSERKTAQGVERDLRALRPRTVASQNVAHRARISEETRRRFEDGHFSATPLWCRVTATRGGATRNNA